LLKNCDEAIVAKSRERNGAHGEELAIAVVPSCGLESSLGVCIRPHFPGCRRLWLSARVRRAHSGQNAPWEPVAIRRRDSDEQP
jgi:hypothetical protein